MHRRRTCADQISDQGDVKLAVVVEFGAARLHPAVYGRLNPHPHAFQGESSGERAKLPSRTRRVLRMSLRAAGDDRQVGAAGFDGDSASDRVAMRGSSSARGDRGAERTEVARCIDSAHSEVVRRTPFQGSDHEGRARGCTRLCEAGCRAAAAPDLIVVDVVGFDRRVPGERDLGAAWDGRQSSGLGGGVVSGAGGLPAIRAATSRRPAWGSVVRRA